MLHHTLQCAVQAIEIGTQANLAGRLGPQATMLYNQYSLRATAVSQLYIIKYI